MNYEAQVIQLRRMKNEIVTARLGLSTNPVQPNSHGLDKILAQAAGWDNKIRLIQRELKSRSHHNAMVMGQNRFGATRHAARQSFDGKQKNLQTLYNATLEVAHELTHLVQQAHGGAGPTQRALEGIKSALQNLSRQGGDPQSESFGLGGQEQVITATVRQLERDFQVPPGSMPASGIVDVFTLLLSYYVLLKTLKKNQR